MQRPAISAADSPRAPHSAVRSAVATLAGLGHQIAADGGEQAVQGRAEGFVVCRPGRGAGGRPAPRPFRDLIYPMPPYLTGDDDLARICAAVRAAALSSARRR